MLNFSVLLAMGNVEEAYNAVRSIKNSNIWESLAKMCVKTRKYSVAKIWMENMKFAPGVQAIR